MTKTHLGAAGLDWRSPLSKDMEGALGRFLTEVGEVENVMFETILAVAPEPPNEVHGKSYSLTMGPKVDMLEKATQHPAFDEHRDAIVQLMGMLRALVPQRDNLIHGETFHITSRGESKSFRVGFTRRNLTPWKDFDFGGNAKKYFHSRSS